MIVTLLIDKLHIPYPLAVNQEYSFFSPVDDSIDLASQKSDKEFLNIKICLDSKYQEIQRTVLTLSDVVANVGGVNQISIVCGALFVGAFANKIYAASLLSNL